MASLCQARSGERTNVISALVNALGRALVRDESRSVYETQGVIFI